MQISAQTLLASQQAAQAKTAAPGFAVSLDKSEGFAPLPLKQAVPMPERPMAAISQPAAPSRPGAVLDIRI
jgi:hypothetical protein